MACFFKNYFISIILEQSIRLHCLQRAAESHREHLDRCLRLAPQSRWLSEEMLCAVGSGAEVMFQHGGSQ